MIDHNENYTLPLFVCFFTFYRLHVWRRGFGDSVVGVRVLELLWRIEMNGESDATEQQIDC